jgi:hypothetical protein
MLGGNRHETRAKAFLGLIILLFFSTPTRAAENVWQSTFGQAWFYEVRSYPEEVLAGTWWEQSLSPGNTYNIRFNVKSLKGKMGLLVGNNAAVTISQAGSYSFDFHISSTGKRRMLFKTLSSNVLASVNSIQVAKKSTSTSTTSGGSSGGTWMPKGHYVAFDFTRNLKTELASANKSNYHLVTARGIDQALSTPGVKGAWMRFHWRTLETGDGRYNWSIIDDNMEVARRYGLKFIVAISDRSFDGSNVLPAYFPSQYVLWTSGGGKTGVVSKRWDPWVYNRLIRLHKAIANRYAANPAFGGIATSETAMGSFNSDYTVAKYRTALTQVITQTQAALKSGKLFLYMNFIKGGDNMDMNKDTRVSVLRDVPHGALAVGGPDITPDLVGMPGSASSYRVHVRKKMPGVNQFCHAQHVDQGQGGHNVKGNKHRQEYLNRVATVRQREQQYWFTGTPAVFEFDDLRDPNGNSVKLHPSWVLGQRWKLDELFKFARRNFNCSYMIWHYRERVGWGEFTWQDVRNVILNNQYF